MKIHKIKILYTLCIILLFSSLLTFTSFAHSGRTDSQGGHHDYQNKSGLGSYHYHHGMGPHLHPNGVCPYSSGNSTQSSNSSSKSSDYIKVEDYPTTLSINESTTILFTMYSYYNDFSYTIESSNPNVIKVQEGDIITAVGEGTADIIIKTSHAEKRISITVKEIYAEKLKISVPSNELQIGEKTRVISLISPSNTTNTDLVYSSSNKRVASISNDGTITGKTSGITTITVTTSNGISENIELNVFELFPEKIKCEDSINFIVGDTYNLNIDILPENANSKRYTVSYDDHDIIEYNEQQLKALKEGNTILHIETWNGIKKDIPVKVDIIPVEQVSIQDSTEYIYSNIIDKSSDIKLVSEIYPDNATYKNVIWKSSDDKVVSINDDGFIIKGVGRVTLSCITHNNISKDIEIIVIDENMIYVIFILLICGSTGVGIAIFRRKRNSDLKPKNEWKYLI